MAKLVYPRRGLHAQALHPVTKRYLLIDRNTGRIVREKKSPGPFFGGFTIIPGVPFNTLNDGWQLLKEGDKVVSYYSDEKVAESVCWALREVIGPLFVSVKVLKHSNPKLVGKWAVIGPEQLMKECRLLEMGAVHKREMRDRFVWRKGREL